MLGCEPGNCALADVVAAGDAAQCLALVAALNRLALLVRVSLGLRPRLCPFALARAAFACAGAAVLHRLISFVRQQFMRAGDLNNRDFVQSLIQGASEERPQPHLLEQAGERREANNGSAAQGHWRNRPPHSKRPG